MIELSGVSKTYAMNAKPVHALRQVDLRVKRGEYVAVLGPSGSGKSTLMHIIGCLDTPTAGGYRFQGSSVDGLSRNELAQIRNERVGFVFQSFHLLPRASATENVELPLVFGKVPLARRRRTAADLLERVGLGQRLDHLPSELSGGERQRVAIARALANAPDLVLADEPTGNLDSKSGEEVMALFGELHAEGRTLIVVTHDANVAQYARRIIRLLDGRVVADTPQPGAEVGERSGR
ncbi:MAG: ABC transporter ATP-binding protein [Planctomycetota bacterium]|jgi:putative ABC transport system ATP-binding protein